MRKLCIISLAVLAPYLCYHLRHNSATLAVVTLLASRASLGTGGAVG